MDLSFVAFIDILGFGEMVISDVESAHPGEKYLPRLKSAIHSALAQANKVEARITQFSDSIVIASLFRPDPVDFTSFIELTRSFQKLLFESEILCRGGVSHGRHYHEETLIFSQGLIEAYRLESSVAINPRIVLSADTIDLIFPTGITSSLVLSDADDKLFLDYVSDIPSSKVAEVLDSLRPVISAADARARAKIAWLFHYAKFVHPDLALPEEITLRRL